MTRATHRNLLATAPLALAPLLAPAAAHASMFQGETLDAVANGIAWVVLILVPIVVLVVFWLVHILPEKIAEQRRHPQAKAIQVLCLLSLVFGGMLWPLAWLWAYSKPVLYKMAYGTDVAEEHHGESDRGAGGHRRAPRPHAAGDRAAAGRSSRRSKSRLGTEARG